MKIHITDTPNSLDEEYVIQNLWVHNQQYSDVDIRPIFLTITDDKNQIIAGLIAKTWWGGLEIQYLWVNEKHRTKGFGRQLMLQAEEEALKRHCHMAYVDTFNFQARGFYEKLGYKVYGKLVGYAHKYTRFYLAKKFIVSK
ncbi:GNAT family N-acetyltransferase [Xenorhabdus sp. XENO-10]|uniref:GNAT family N-acetyltransferase n=1 Tax=Xenorhabdus yunnanensis TaxID=3025878 RepID=A0ABT5LKM8_9GAMM|nr:GNAT family N-acetyltransferase [Xenorhabdus yunnanensis]MDC9591534.1 GNAT family N-acetyltransferase [Xenorhabdus yunnanensis]